MKKITTLILVLALALTCFTGCDKKETSADGKVTLHIGLPSGDALTPLELIDEFEKANPDITVTTDEAPWNDFRKKLDMQIGGNNAPDVFITDSGHATSIASKGVLMDISEKISSELNAEEYTDALFALKDAEGKVWGVPHAINTVALYYNEELFDKAGLEYPSENWTWDDMLDAAKKLTTPKDKNGISSVYGFGLASSMTLGWYPVILANGGSPLNADKTKSNFNDPKTVAGVKKFEEIVKSGVTPPLPWYSTQGGALAAFYQGKLAMTFMQGSSVQAVAENNPELKFNVAEMPIGWDGERRTIYVPNVWVVNGRSSEAKQEAAWKWLQFYLSEETQLKLAETRLGGFPINKKALDYCDTIEAVPENMAVFYRTIDENAVTLSENATWAAWKKETDSVFKDLYNGMFDADEAAKKADSKISKELEG
ncbi:MAG: sugar ABC transporter substrate-binding protein [Clostridia bacterium]|nr:sugar ABC transporter substrate-binding protein [Clostridia bacterium]